MFQSEIKHKIHEANPNLQDLCLKVGIDIQPGKNEGRQNNKTLVIKLNKKLRDLKSNSFVVLTYCVTFCTIGQTDKQIAGNIWIRMGTFSGALMCEAGSADGEGALNICFIFSGFVWMRTTNSAPSIVGMRQHKKTRSRPIILLLVSNFMTLFGVAFLFRNGIRGNM